MINVLQPATEIPLCCGSHTVTLRASLRVAVALESVSGGITSLWENVAQQKLTALHAVIKEAATDRLQAELFLSHASRVPLVQFVGSAQAACLTLLASILAPAQGEATPTEPSTDPMPLAQFFTELFSRATSWLGWPPSEVWNASVAEIVTALEAQAERELRRAGVTPSDKLKGRDVYTKERLQEIEEIGFDPAFDRAGLQALKARQ